MDEEKPAYDAGLIAEGMRGGRVSRIASGKMDKALSAGIPAGTAHQLEKGMMVMSLHKCTMRGRMHDFGRFMSA